MSMGPLWYSDQSRNRPGANSSKSLFDATVFFPVTIDIKPGSYPNSINLKKGGVIPVAILTTDVFDATTVDADTVRFGPRGAEKVHTTAHYEDVDGKGGFYSFLLSFFEIHGYLPLNYRKV